MKLNLEGETENQKILIYSFPTPIFERKFINLNENTLKGMKLSIDDVRIKALHYLKDTDHNHFRNYMDEMDIQFMSLKSALLQKMKGSNFNEFYERHSIPKLFKTRKSTLLNYFKEDAPIKKISNQ